MCMSAFDGVLLGILATCLTCFIQFLLCEKGTRRRATFIGCTCLLFVFVAGICATAKYFRWESSLLGISALESAEAAEGTQSFPDVSEGIIAEVKILDEMQSRDCPRLILNETEIYSGQTEYELVWEPFDDYTEYKVFVYERNGDVFDLLSAYATTGYSFHLDISSFEEGKTYSINIAVADTYFSAPIIIEMKSFTDWQ